MASASQSAPARTVVLLRPTERKRLQKLAAAERVSSGEILRRSLRAYEPEISAAEAEALAILLVEMNTALDGALTTVRSARTELRENLKKIAQMKEAQA